jgi:sRNA-binding protein
VSKQAKLAAANAALAVLCEKFPAAFTTERCAPHKPLKSGIDKDMVARRVLSAMDVRTALRFYVLRPMYQRALSASGPRFGLDGDQNGAVSADQVKNAAAMIAHIEARAAGAFEAAKKAHQQNPTRHLQQAGAASGAETATATRASWAGGSEASVSGEAMAGGAGADS